MISNHFRDSVSGPEKVGVGGSIPSLATNNFVIQGFKDLPKLSRCAAGSIDMLPRQLRIVFRILIFECPGSSPVRRDHRRITPLR